MGATVKMVCQAHGGNPLAQVSQSLQNRVLLDHLDHLDHRDHLGHLDQSADHLDHLNCPDHLDYLDHHDVFR